MLWFPFQPGRAAGVASPGMGPGPHLLMIWISRHQRSRFFGLSSCRHCLMAICSPVAYRKGTLGVRTINPQTPEHHRALPATQTPWRTSGEPGCPLPRPHITARLLPLPNQGHQSSKPALSLYPPQNLCSKFLSRDVSLHIPTAAILG